MAEKPKETLTARIDFRVPQGMFDSLERLAAAEERGLSDFLRLRLAAIVANAARKRKPRTTRPRRIKTRSG